MCVFFAFIIGDKLCMDIGVWSCYPCLKYDATWQLSETATVISSCMMRHIFSAVFPNISTLNSDFSANKQQQTTLALSALVLMECDGQDRSWIMNAV